MQNPRKYILLAAIAALFVGALLVFFNTRTSTHLITVTTSDQATVKLYRGAQGDGSTNLSYDSSSVVGEGQGTSVFKVKDGHYVAVVSQDSFTESKKSIVVSGRDKTVSVELELSAAKLSELLSAQELAVIHAAISAKYPRIGLYTIQTGKLYKRGQWYATTLIYNDSSDIFNSDTLRIILEKKSDKWTVITDPPELLISKAVYPQIPGEIIDDINSQ